jgi:protoporphyrinogen oxidase
MSRVEIVGAGPAGLMAAWHLARAGHDPVLYEASGHIGGMAGSFEVAGQRVDYGSHRLHPSTPPWLLAELRGLLGEELQTRPRNGRIRLHGKWVGFPLRGTDLARSLPPRFTASVAVDTVLRPLRRGRPENFLEEVSARMGPTVARDFYGPYARKLYGVPPEQLDVEQARRRISAASPLDVARRAVGGRQRVGSFLYPRSGYGTIVERLAEAAVAAGTEIRLDTPSPRIDSTRPTLFTAAPSVLAGLLDPAPPPEVTAALASQVTRAMVLVYVVVGVDRYTQFDAHYLPGAETAISRLSEPKNYRDGSDPEGHTVLCAELPCWPDDAVWNSSPPDLGEQVVSDLARLGLPAVRPLDVEVRRLPSVYPVYERRSVAARATIRRWVQTLDGVLVLGRQGLAVPDNLHHVLAMGRDAAACVGVDGSIDRAAWLAALDRFEAHVVED